jgi:hypothetical protein
MSPTPVLYRQPNDVNAFHDIKNVFTDYTEMHPGLEPAFMYRELFRRILRHHYLTALGHLDSAVGHVMYHLAQYLSVEQRQEIIIVPNITLEQWCQEWSSARLDGVPPLAQHQADAAPILLLLTNSRN